MPLCLFVCLALQRCNKPPEKQKGLDSSFQRQSHSLLRGCSLLCCHGDSSVASHDPSMKKLLDDKWLYMGEWLKAAGKASKWTLSYVRSKLNFNSQSGMFLVFCLEHTVNSYTNKILTFGVSQYTEWCQSSKFAEFCQLAIKQIYLGRISTQLHIYFPW